MDLEFYFVYSVCYNPLPSVLFFAAQIISELANGQFKPLL